MTSSSPAPDSAAEHTGEGRGSGPGRAVGTVVIIALLSAGVAWAGSQGGIAVAGAPVFALAVGWIFAVQIVGFAHAYAQQTEHYFDLLGSLTYITVILGALLASGRSDATALLLTGAVAIWAARLGSFLFARVKRSGSDDRFDAIKPDFWRFLTVWMMQGLWVTLTLGAALAAVTSPAPAGLHVVTVIGLILWLAGFALEVAADSQKNQFRADPANRGRFISTGVWAWSRHPNYFGEIVAWLGIAIAAFPVLHGWQYLTLISPVFVAVLLTRISGVPLLERKAEARWGDRPDYRAYRDATPVLIPRPPRGDRSAAERS